MVSSTGTVSYNTSKELANILKPLVGWTPHHLKNTKDFIEQIKDVKLLPDETIISYEHQGIIHICANTTSHQHYQEHVGEWQRSETQNIYEHTSHHQSAGNIASKVHILYLEANIMNN